MLLLTLGGTPTLYYGEEIGMTGVPIPPEESRDPQGRRIGRTRDPERTPMQWEASPKAGFTTNEPWLPIGEDVNTANIASQREDPHSLLTLYRRLIQLRTEHPALVAGSVEVVSHEDPLLAYRRVHDDGQYLVVLNMGYEAQVYGLGEQTRGVILVSTFLDHQGEEVSDTIELRGTEGILLRLSST
jgi:alpha-glucosidase